MGDFTPRTIVEELDRYIVGQKEAKKAVAIALSNRERRRRLPAEIRSDVIPKNILMIGPTGVGKTEIARRLAAMIDAPFIKVEATRFTEVGYVGRDAESIIHDLVEMSARKVYHEQLKQVESSAQRLATDRIVGYLYQQMTGRGRKVVEKGQPAPRGAARMAKGPAALTGGGQLSAVTRERLAKLLASNKLEDHFVEIEVSDADGGGMFFDPRLDMELDGDPMWLEEPCRGGGGRSQRKKKVRVREARRILVREEANKLLDFDQVVDRAVADTEENGLVFIDEIDKLCGPKMDIGRDVSGEGVQRDMLPLLEGATVMTRYGPLNTEHILFIAAGTFSQNKPSDLIPELQGRFPLRVELNPLTREDFEKILTEPRNSLTNQYKALMATEGVALRFAPDGIREIARLAVLMNERMENIGARRLFTIIEKLVEDLSFTASERKGERVVIDADYVSRQVGSLVKDENLSRYIL